MSLIPRLRRNSVSRRTGRTASAVAIESLEPRCLLSAGWTTTHFTGRDRFNDVVVQPDGKILASGSKYWDVGTGMIVARYNVDGTLDRTFDGDGKLILENGDEARTIALQPDGRILLAAPWLGEVIRLNPDGSLDTSFGTAGRWTTQGAFEYAGGIGGMAVQPDGKIVVGVGSQDGSGPVILRLTSEGAIDAGFGDDGLVRVEFPDVESPGEMRELVIDAAGRILLASTVQKTWEEVEIAIVRLQPDGGFDSSFGNAGIVFETFGSHGAISNYTQLETQPDGRVLLAGNTSSGYFALMRLNVDGSPDGSFSGDAVVPIDGFIGDILVQPNGRILVTGAHRGGVFGEWETGLSIWRFLPDGSPDTSFSGDGFVKVFFNDLDDNDEGNALALRPDGRIIAVGVADYVPGSALVQAAIVQLRPNGSLDPAFGNSVYALDVFEPNDAMETASNLGSGDQYLTGLTIHDPGNDDWYRWTASDDGTLTVDLVFRHDTGNLTLELYTPAGLRVGRSNTSTDNERVSRAVTAGEVFFIRATAPFDGTSSNYTLSIDGPGVREPVVSGSTVHVYGMAGDDVFTFKAGSTHVVTVNGHTFRYAASAVSTIRFHGEAGNDSLTITGTDGDETANIQLGSLTVNGPGYRVTGDSIENVIVIGRGGNDSATLIDSPGDDRLTMKPTLSRLAGTGFSHEVRGFERVVARATSGGTDRADFFDSSGNDRVNMKPTYSEMIAPGFTNRAVGFDRVIAIAGAGGGDDRAYLYDSPGDDSLKARPRQVVFTGPGFSNDARNFNQVLAYATRGGSNDQAFLHDSAGDDRLVMKAGSSRMSGDGFYNNVQAFDRVTAYANNGGTDRVDFYDSTGNDEFVGRPAQSKMTGPGFVNVANNFELVYAYATLGGTDTARLFDSGGEDRYTSRTNYARMEGAGFYLDTRDFETVLATASSANAEANLLDFATGERVSGAGSAFRADRANRVERLFGFGRIKVTAASGQTPQSTVDPLEVDYLFETVGTWI